MMNKVAEQKPISPANMRTSRVMSREQVRQQLLELDEAVVNLQMQNMYLKLETSRAYQRVLVAHLCLIAFEVAVFVLAWLWVVYY